MTIRITKLLTWKKIADKGAVAEGKGKAFKIDGKQIAVFNQGGYHALDDLCVHQGRFPCTRQTRWRYC